MFKLTTITRAGVVAVVCVAVAAPQALAKSPVKGAKAKAAKVQSVKQSASSGGESAVLRAALSTAYAQGCLNGTLPDRTMGGDNNNYEYYGDVCTVSVPLNGASLALLATGEPSAAAPPAGRMFYDSNTNYEYYGSPSGS